MLFLKEHFQLELHFFNNTLKSWELRKVVPNTLKFAQVINSIDLNSFQKKYHYIDEDEFNTYNNLKTKLENKQQLDCLKKFNLNQELERDQFD